MYGMYEVYNQKELPGIDRQFQVAYKSSLLYVFVLFFFLTVEIHNFFSCSLFFFFFQPEK